MSLRNAIYPVVACLWLAAVLLAGVAACTSDSETATAPEQEGGAASFTFLNLGVNTPLNDAVRKNLESHLGDGYAETRAPVDLTLRPRGLLESRIPKLYALHRRFISDVGHRVEHNITRITYRYPRREGTPFVFVRTVFSNYNHLPLYFRITMNEAGASVVEKLRDKYGKPDTISMPGAEEVFHWEKNGDALVVSRMTNRLGNPEYDVMFYFVKNLTDLLATEETERLRKEEKLRKAGETAF
ncbi:MAG: hypothetical protein LJE65_01820 [Desulfobacteraceae bacterium]|nr:hypothetical protein [Desulfobacteraceae bacterium]